MDQFARTPKDMGHVIRQARKAKKLTQADLAARSGVWQETISKIEANAAGAKLETVFDLLAALDLEMEIRTRSKGAPADFEDIF